MTQMDRDSYISSIKEVIDLFNKNETETALDLCQKFTREAPEMPESFFLLGVIAHRAKDAGQAIHLIEVAHKLDPDCQDYAEALATIYTEVGKMTDGLFYAKLATALTPHKEIPGLCPPHLRNYANALTQSTSVSHYLTALRAYNNRDYTTVIDVAIKELRIDGTHLDCRRLLGRALCKTGEFPRASATFQAAVHMAPNSALDTALLGGSLLHEGRFFEARASLQRAAKLAPFDSEVIATVLKSAQMLPPELTGGFQSIATKWRRSLKMEQIKNEFDPEPKTKIRIGYISDSFTQNTQANLLRALLLFHNRNTFEIYVYQNFSIKDSMTTPFENAVDSWREIYDVDDETAGYIMAADDLDILVDLNLDPHYQRHALLASHPARVQISWMGHPEATGWPGIDVVLCDAITLAGDQKASSKTERCIKLRGGLFAHEQMPNIQRPQFPAAVNDFVTYVGLMDLVRLHPDTAALWSEVLYAAPNSVLLLGSEDAMPNESRLHVMSLFANFGLADRIRFHDPSDEDLDTFGPLNTLFAAGDIMLDTAPISCGTACIQALWMGLPVITMMGKNRAQSLGASILTAANQEDWVCKTKKDYISIAATLGRDIGALEKRSEELKENNLKSTLFNPPLFTRTVEEAYRSILAENISRMS